MTLEIYLKRVPGAQALVDAGIRPQAAVRLARSGFTSLEKIAAATRDELLSVYGVNLRTVEDCEAIVGRTLPWPTAYWRDRGLSSQLARVLCSSRIDSLEALGKMSYKDMRGLGLGAVSIRKCEKVLGRFFEGD